MGILTRFIQLMKANMYELTDDFLNSGNQVDKILRDMTLDLRTIQSEANAINTNEQRLKRDLLEIDEQINKLTNFAEKARDSGDDAKAMRFDTEKAVLEERKEKSLESYNAAIIESKQIKLLEEKMMRDVQELNERAAKLKSTKIELKTQQKINDSLSSPEVSLEDYETQLQLKIDEANALTELRSNPNRLQNSEQSIDEEIASLMKK